MCGAKVQIRRLTPEDAALYRDIRLEALRCCPEVFSSTFEQESAQSLEWFADRLGRSDVVAAIDGSDILGMAGLLVHHGKGAHTGRIWGVYVRAGARQTGLGRKLIEAVIEIAWAKIEVIQLSVVTENAPAHRLYLSLGFREYGIERKSLKHKGRYYDEYLMALDLTEVKTSSSATKIAGEHKPAGD